jgi:hypothetical protein
MLASVSLGGEEAMHVLNSRDGHAAEVPSANGIGNARSLARLYAALVGEVDGVRLLHPDTVERVRVAQTDRMTGPQPFGQAGSQLSERGGQGSDLRGSSRYGARMAWNAQGAQRFCGPPASRTRDPRLRAPVR